MALRPKVLQKKAEKFELKKLLVVEVTKEGVSTLDTLLQDVYANRRPKQTDYEARKDLIRVFNETAKELYGTSNDIPVVVEFGSFVIDLFSTTSDLVLSVNFSTGGVDFPREEKIQTLRKFARKRSTIEDLFYNESQKCISGLGHVSGVLLITSAKVPILKCVDRGTGVDCDISVENRDGISKSQIIGIIASIDERFEKLSFLMKTWAKAHNINSSNDKTLNSLSIILLVAFHLQCTSTPEPPLYGGGIIVNPELNDDNLTGWAAAGNALIGKVRSADGNNFVVVSNILTNQSDGLSQTFSLDKHSFYTVLAWFQASTGEAAVQAKLVASTGNKTAAWVTARSGCWTMLKGGFSGNLSEFADLRFESGITGVDIWVDSVSLQPFTPEEWTAHQRQSVDKVRKGQLRLEVTADENGNAAGAAISIRQLQPNFPFGCAVNLLITNNTAYQKWFLAKKFKYSVFENELKWAYTEKTQGVVDYSLPDAMLDFCKSNNITVRGHNILWDDEDFQAQWVIDLNKTEPKELKAAVKRRVDSVVKRYEGQFIHWDVINENLHNDFFSRLVSRNGSRIYRRVHHLDPHAIPFLNEFNVIEGISINGPAGPWKYLQKINQMRNGGYHGPLGIGLESHFDDFDPDFAYIRASLDVFAATGLPIWITEFDVGSNKDPNMVKNIDPILRELHSHATVDGIILWAALGDNLGCYKMCLTDNDFRNLPAGDAVDRFMEEFINVADTTGNTDMEGVFEARLFHGEYEAVVTLRDGATASVGFSVVPGVGVVRVRVSV